MIRADIYAGETFIALCAAYNPKTNEIRSGWPTEYGQQMHTWAVRHSGGALLLRIALLRATF